MSLFSIEIILRYLDRDCIVDLDGRLLWKPPVADQGGQEVRYGSTPARDDLVLLWRLGREPEHLGVGFVSLRPVAGYIRRV